MCHPDLPAGSSESAIAGEEVAIPVDGGPMPAYRAKAPGRAPRGSVVIVGEIYGARTPLYEHVARLRAPLLGFWGNHDERVGIANVQVFAAALAAQGVSFEHTVYPGLDHGFLRSGFDPVRPGTKTLRLRGSERSPTSMSTYEADVSHPSS